ncbi:MAG: hypothetical protein V3T05_10785 [Myxococcota bacterium]
MKSCFRATLIVIVAALAACGGQNQLYVVSQPPLRPTAEPPTLAHALEQGVELTLAGPTDDDDGSWISFALAGEMAPDDPKVRLPIRTGGIVVWLDPDGSFWIDGLSIELDELTVDADAVPPDGILLSDLRVTLAERAVAEPIWNDDRTALEAELTLELQFNWSWRQPDGDEAHPLAPQSISGLLLTLRVSTDAEQQLSLAASGQGSGLMWILENMFGDGNSLELYDPALELVGGT